MSEDLAIQNEEFTALLELLGADSMREVVAMFLDAAPGRVAMMQAALTGGDATAAATAAHSMRSGCGQLGARRLEALCAEIERGLKRGDQATAFPLVPQAAAELDRVRAWFAAHDWIAPSTGDI